MGVIICYQYIQISQIIQVIEQSLQPWQLLYHVFSLTNVPSRVPTQGRVT